jgi:hypothetical protein
MIQQIYVEAITEYNDILCGIKKRFSKNVVLNEQVAKEIGRFAFSYYMKWSPNDIKTRLTKDILRKLKLDKLFEKFADFPHELNSKKDMYYYAHWLYPDIIQYDIRSSVLNVYRGVLDGRRALFSMNFFNDDYALERAEICLQEALKRNEFKNEYEMYALFASDQVVEFLEKYKLSKPAQMYYKTPMHYLYSSLPESYQSEFWFNYFVFLPQYQKRVEKK